jgi:acetamidase/formamidase
MSRHRLNPNPKTIHWGYLDSKLEPVLTIDPGDIVIINTWVGCLPEDYEAAGLDPDWIPREVRDIFREVKNRGPGSHILVGPIHINGAELGDMLEVRILDVRLTIPFGHNSIKYQKGALPDLFPYDCIKYYRMDLERMTSEIIPGVVIPLKPFFGTMGVAPPPILGKIGTMAPGIFGGNIDNREFVAGTVLYLPIHNNGALFSVGDGHAAQGDGEVDVSALETPLQGEFAFVLHKKKRIKWPRAETPTHYIAMGFDTDLDVAAEMAVREVIEFLEVEKGINPEDAYRITSLAVDLRVTQVVDGVKGIHAMIPKSIFSET